LRYLALYAKRHIGLVSNVAQEGLACALSSLGSRTGHALPGGVEVAIKNEDLASLADVSIFTASGLLKDWERKGAVEKSRGKVLIRVPKNCWQHSSGNRNAFSVFKSVTNGAAGLGRDGQVPKFLAGFRAYNARFLRK
jgi:hypothetical protein